MSHGFTQIDTDETIITDKQIMSDFIPYKKRLHQHDEAIRQEFQDRPTEALARETGLNYYTVSRKAARMGISKTDDFMRSSWKKGGLKKGGWKKPEMRAKVRETADKYMREHFADTKNEELARMFGVDVKTVRRWARRLGLVKSAEFMQTVRSKGCCGKKKRYYTDEYQAWRRQRIAEVYPDGDEAALQALADELGIAMSGLLGLATEFGIHRSEERKREAIIRGAARHTKYGPEVIAALREYYTDHTTAECAERFGISAGVINQLAVKHGMRKSPEHKHRIYSETQRARRRKETLAKARI